MKTVLSILMLLVFSMFVSSATMVSKIQVSKDDSTTIMLNQKLDVNVSNNNLDYLIKVMNNNSTTDSILASSLDGLSVSMTNFINSQTLKDKSFVKLEEMYSLPRDSIKQSIVKHNFNVFVCGALTLALAILIYLVFFHGKTKNVNSIVAWSVIYALLAYWINNSLPDMLDYLNNSTYLLIHNIIMFSG
jgi:hypothetical protein